MTSPKKRGLGRGLDALLAQTVPQAGSPPGGMAPTGNPTQQIAIQCIQPGVHQPRRVLDPAALHELSESIKRHGLLQPILVREAGRDRYEIIAGERRWRAAELAGLSSISALVYNVNELDAAAMALIENIQRENLNAMEEARALTRLIKEFELTHQQVAEAVGRSRAAVTNLLRLMELHEEVQQVLERGDIEMGHARALLALQPGEQLRAARQVVAKGLSVRETEALVRNWDTLPKTTPARERDPNLAHLETALSERLAAVVKIAHSAKGRGSVTIYYHSLDELDGILDRIQKTRLCKGGESGFSPLHAAE